MQLKQKEVVADADLAAEPPITPDRTERPVLDQSVANSLGDGSTIKRQKGRPKQAAKPIPAQLENAKDLARRLVQHRKNNGTSNVVKPSAQTRKDIVEAAARVEQSIPSDKPGNEVWRELEAATGHTKHQLKAWIIEDGSQKLDRWLEAEKKRRESAGGARIRKRFHSTDKGVRMKADGSKKQTKPDPFAAQTENVGKWARGEQLKGIELNATDLLDEFCVVLDTERFELACDGERGELSAEQQKRHDLLVKALAMINTKHGRNYRLGRLKAKTGFVERKPGNVMPMTEAEADLVVELTWQSLDCLTNMLMTGSAEQLASFVAEPETLIQERESIAMIFEDAVPVYLDPSTGKVLVAFEHLDDENRRRAQQLLRRTGKTAQASRLELDFAPAGQAKGASRRDKNRLTWICRQKIEGLFGLQPGELPRGGILPSVLLVPSNQPCRLEDMSLEEPAVWLRAHTVMLGDRTLERKAGQPVGKLLSAWREARGRQPRLFSGDVLFWGQGEATMDESISHFLVDLRSNEAKHLLLEVDCVGCEQTLHVTGYKFLHNQVQHNIGVKQTARMQITDIRYAKIGKDAQRPEAAAIRRGQRLRASREGVAPTHESKATDCARLANAMHSACVKDNAENNGVLRAARMGAQLAVVPTADGLRKADGPEWDDFPLGSSRLGSAVLGRRFAHINEHGFPALPDWSRLNALRDRMLEESPEGKQRAAREAKENKEAGEEQRQPEMPPVASLLDLTPGSMGLGMFDDQDEAEPITTDILALKDPILFD